MNERGAESLKTRGMAYLRRNAKRDFGIAALGLAIGTSYGVSHASADDPFGPNQANYSVNMGGDLVADFGPLGSVEHTAEGVLPPMANLFNLGVYVKVGEIPEFTPVEDSKADIGSILSSDFSSYAQFFSHPEVIANTVARDLVEDAFQKSLLASGFATAGLAASYQLLGSRRRQELAPYKRKAALGAMTLIALASCAGDSRQPEAHDSIQSNDIFIGTSLEGARVTGRLGDLLNIYGPKVMDYIQNTNEYYDNISDNLAEALSDYNMPIENTDNIVTALVVSDLHCNINMAKPLNTIQQAIGNELVINSGDMVISGTEPEKYCVETLSSANPDGTQVILSLGNHDSELTAEQARDAGFEVLDGDPVTYTGLTFLGSSDPRRSDFGKEIYSTNGETVEQQGKKLAETACAQDEPIDIIVAHDNNATTETMERGCALTSLTGHLHQSEGPFTLDNGGVWYVSGTAAGASEGSPTIESELGSTSQMSIWLFDRETGRAIYMRIISIQPDGSVDVSDWESL